MEVSLWKAVLSVHGGRLHTHSAQTQRPAGRKTSQTVWNPRRWIVRPNTPTIGEAPTLAPPRRRAGRRLTALRLACVAPPVLVSTFIVAAGSVLLPDWAGGCVFYGGLAAAILLGTGLAEPVGVRVRFGARKMTIGGHRPEHRGGPAVPPAAWPAPGRPARQPASWRSAGCCSKR